MRCMKEEKRTELLNTHNRQDWTGKLLTHDLTGRKGILQIHECEQGIDLGNGLGSLHLWLRPLRFQLRWSSQIAERAACLPAVPSFVFITCQKSFLVGTGIRKTTD